MTKETSNKKKGLNTLNGNAKPSETKTNSSIQGNQEQGELIACNPNIVNKVGHKTIAAYNDSFQNIRVTRDELINLIKKEGNALSSALTCSTRKKENFKEANYVFLDFDGGMSLKDAKENEFFKKYASFLYSTPSHQKEGKGDRFRAVLKLPNPEINVNEYENLINGLLKTFLQADQNCKDPTRLFFGSQDCEIVDFGNVLSIDQVKKLKLLGKVPSCKSSDPDEVFLLPHYKSASAIPEKIIKEMLSHIDPKPGRDVWRDLSIAVKSWGLPLAKTDKELMQIIEEWSPDYKNGGKDLERILRDYKTGKISVGTLIYYAQKSGYQLPKNLWRKRTAGQVAYEDLFNDPDKYASIGETLYEYHEGYFQKIPDEVIRKSISDYFDRYITEIKTGFTGYAAPNHVESAMKYVKQRHYRNPDKVNPPGINLVNGYLKLSYGENNNPIFTLLDHSSKYFFTYKADCKYLPDVDSTVFDEVVSNILDEAQQKILFRTIAAAFDISKVRIVRGRSVRILLLHGEGSNGKDTIRSWVHKLFKDQGMTCIGLEAFRNADRGRLFGIFDLVGSRINWASENRAIALDQCQSLKNVATGDPLQVEEKNKQGVTIEPKTVLFFNVNKFPHIEAQQEAIIGRYGILDFKNIFKVKPNPNNEWEKQADPRLKEDKHYIAEYIMPSLLNRLILEYKNLLSEGIDFSCNTDLMQRIKEENNHLIEFASYNGLVECPAEEGLTASDIEKRYLKYCTMLGLKEVTASGIKYHDPSRYDRIIRDIRHLTRRLKEIYPRLDVKRTSKERKLGLKFTIDEDELGYNDISDVI